VDYNGYVKIKSAEPQVLAELQAAGFDATVQGAFTYIDATPHADEDDDERWAAIDAFVEERLGLAVEAHVGQIGE